MQHRDNVKEKYSLETENILLQQNTQKWITRKERIITFIE